MSELSLPWRIALAVFLVPFVVAGTRLANAAHSLLCVYVECDVLSWILQPLFTLAGLFIGCLVAYGILVFLFAWLAPNSLLIADSEVPQPTLSYRVIYPVLRMVKKFALWLVPGPRRP